MSANYWDCICLDCEKVFREFHENCPYCGSSLTTWAD